MSMVMTVMTQKSVLGMSSDSVNRHFKISRTPVLIKRLSLGPSVPYSMVIDNLRRSHPIATKLSGNLHFNEDTSLALGHPFL